MARSRQSTYEDLIDLATLLPPWLALILAAISYFALHQVSLIDIPAVTSTSPSDIGHVFRSSLVKQGAAGGQYLLPPIFVIGALLSYLKRRKGEKLLKQTQIRGKTSALLEINWQEFEQLVGAAFARSGYTVRESGGPRADGGVDITLLRNNETFLVQCKQWRAQQVGVATVRELYGVMAARGATGGFLVCSGSFSSDAMNFAKGRNIELIGGEGLLDFIGREAIPARTAARPLISAPSTSPDCPSCGTSMVRRVASKGKNAGSAFWGCATYPKCRGTRPLITFG